MQRKQQLNSVNSFAFYDPSTPAPNHQQQQHAYPVYEPLNFPAQELQAAPQNYNYILDEHISSNQTTQQESLLQQHETQRQQLELALDNQISDEIIKLLAKQAKDKKSHPKLKKVLGPDKYYPNPIMMRSIQVFSSGLLCILLAIGFYAFEWFNDGDPYLIFMFCLNIVVIVYCFLVITWGAGEVLSFLASILCQVIVFAVLAAQIAFSMLAIVVGCFAYRLADHRVLYTIAENLIYGGIWLCVPLILLFLLTLQAIRIRLPEVNDLPDPKYVDTHRTGIDVAGPKRELVYCVPDYYWDKLKNKIKNRWQSSQQKTQYIEDNDDQEEIPNFERESI